MRPAGTGHPPPADWARPAPAPETPLLAADEPPPFELVNPAGRGAAVLTCDHAANRIPRSLGSLGLAPVDLARHIAWDLGAAELARGLADRLDAPLILGGWSRLVVDLNRPLASPELIPEASDGVQIPGNRGLTPGERARRIAALFDPYRLALSGLLDARAARPTLLIALHSFTPSLAGQARPWHAGIASGRDRRLAQPLIDALARHGGLCIGDNRPYDLDPVHDYSLPTHGEARGIPHAVQRRCARLQATRRKRQVPELGSERPENVRYFYSTIAMVFA
jgi:predicted N-formylglutamate amidohydrolase